MYVISMTSSRRPADGMGKPLSRSVRRKTTTRHANYVQKAERRLTYYIIIFFLLYVTCFIMDCFNVMHAMVWCLWHGLRPEIKVNWIELDWKKCIVVLHISRFFVNTFILGKFPHWSWNWMTFCDKNGNYKWIWYFKQMILQQKNREKLFTAS